MKGPGLRVELDVRRIWECPACGRRDRFLGDVVSLRCPCQEGGVNMKLVESRRQVRQFDVTPFQRASELPRTAQQDESPVPCDAPPMVETVETPAVAVEPAIPPIDSTAPSITESVAELPAPTSDP